jgi:hypothetical protein
MTEELINNVEETEDVSDSTIVRIFRFLLRITVVIIFGIILGISAYLGVPAIYREFVEPVQTNSRQIEIFIGEFEGLKEDLSSQTMTIEEINGMVEGLLAEQRESIAELTAKVAVIDVAVIELEEGAKNIVTMEGRLDRVDDVLQEFGSDLEGFSVELEETDTPSAKLSRQLQLIKAMELITRARFWFLQDNQGKAREDIQSAKEVVELVLTDGAESEVEVLAGIVERLDQALLAIELTPIVAADDLEIVWQLLILATEP